MNSNTLSSSELSEQHQQQAGHELDEEDDEHESQYLQKKNNFFSEKNTQTKEDDNFIPCLDNQFHGKAIYICKNRYCSHFKQLFCIQCLEKFHYNHGYCKLPNYLQNIQKTVEFSTQKIILTLQKKDENLLNLHNIYKKQIKTQQKLIETSKKNLSQRQSEIKNRPPFLSPSSFHSDDQTSFVHFQQSQITLSKNMKMGFLEANEYVNSCLKEFFEFDETLQKLQNGFKPPVSSLVKLNQQMKKLFTQQNIILSFSALAKNIESETLIIGKFIPKFLFQINGGVKITLKHNEIQPEGVMNLFKGIEKLDSLTNLKVHIDRNNQVEAEGAYFISQSLRNLENLENLYLFIGQNNHIMSSGAESLKELFSHFEQIKNLVLNVQYNNGIQYNSAQGLIEQVQEADFDNYQINIAYEGTGVCLRDSKSIYLENL
ncbi:hypothetical protein PPERSA_00524 [Pseudocohnilembus persalinus]|uniref:Uncharacterized protein n=1 Tax=Pseudocohnilembus persalinus TaxID=266149 RepID=A0A0V0QI00_PSEPJ|nr:hypothetical protein PPERSA_00524 [Pseudocohnilembus persalinus]|eukprot:KRX01814.1 hypothetical protein PPERSA_00524 [Pseudocohnilembus persalinus]